MFFNGVGVQVGMAEVFLGRLDNVGDVCVCVCGGVFVRFYVSNMFLFDMYALFVYVTYSLFCTINTLSITQRQSL